MTKPNKRAKSVDGFAIKHDSCGLLLQVFPSKPWAERIRLNLQNNDYYHWVKSSIVKVRITEIPTAPKRRAR